MNPDYSRLPLSPVKDEYDTEGFQLDRTLEFYDDISLRKKVKTNEGSETSSNFPQYQRPPERQPPPSKPQYPSDRNNYNRQPPNRREGNDTHYAGNRKLTPPTLTEDFIPLLDSDYSDSRESSQTRGSQRQDRPPQWGNNDGRDSNWGPPQQRGYNDRNQQRDYNRPPQQRDYNDRSQQKGYNDRNSQRDNNEGSRQRNYGDRPQQKGWGNDSGSDREWGERSEGSNWGNNAPPLNQGWDNNRSQEGGWGNKPQEGGWGNKAPERGGYNSNRSQGGWGSDRERSDSRPQQGGWDNRGSDRGYERSSDRERERDRDRDYDRPPRRDYDNRQSGRREYSDRDRLYDDSSSEASEYSNRDRNYRDNRPQSNYSRERSDYGGSYQQKREPSDLSWMSQDPNRNNRPTSDLMAKTKLLPIYPFRDEIVEAIQRNQVTIISGDTGCGKSTQVPKYILEDCLRRGKECRIICTQPRRIAAITLAKRVQKEISEMYPNADPKMVGYHIGMETNFNKNSKVIFMTNGIFLQRFIHEDDNAEGGIMKGFTHAILDEVHERDIDSDFIMVALKHVLSRHPNFKLILMSATINAELFARYFSKNEIETGAIKEYKYQEHQKKQLTAWDDKATKWEKAQEKEHKELVAEMAETYKITEGTWGNVKKEEEQQEKKKKKEEEEKEEEIRKQEELKNDVNNYTTVIEINQRHVQAKDKFLIHKKYLDHLKTDMDIKCTLMQSDFSKKKAIFHDECIKVCLQLIAFLTSSKNKIETKYKASIAEEINLEKQLHAQGKKWHDSRKRTYLPYMLIFLPGLSEIYHLMDVIAEEKTLSHLDLDLIPLHSTLSDFNQDRLFRDPQRAEQRKIILSTNIAESSITIPNVLYVIDFCLLKEINTSGRTNIEILDLVWGSKASLQQRAGRTGRVSDGYVFRLIPEAFHERDLDAFSKPELHRSPLDRLILRIKTLHESEKASKKDTTAYLFWNPKEVLGRAIEPPQLESIAIAARNLQDNGALTVSNGPNDLGEITFLGRVYCDLPCEVKISKMILLGLAFGLREEVIALAAVLCQRKSLFRPDSKAVPRNRYAYMKNLWNMSDGTNSDHVALLRTFAFWERKFVRDDATVNQVRKMREKIDEREYCQERQLDPIVLRETYVTKHDIISRLRKLEILKKPEELIDEDEAKEAQRKYFWEDSGMDRSKINEKYAILKFVLAGAFYCTYIRPSEFKRQADTTQSTYIKLNTDMDPLRTIMIRHTYKGIENWDADKVMSTKKNWFKMLKKFNPEEIKFIQDKAYINFGENDYEFAIKTLDYIKRSFYDISRQIAVYNKESGSNVREELTFRHTSKQHSNIFYSHWMDPDCVSLFAGLGEVEYYNGYEFVDYLTRKKIKMEPDSVNNIIPVKKSSAQICLVTQDYFEKKSGVLSAKHSTLIDFEFFECKFLLPLITMIFSPQISLEADEAKTRYKSMMIDSNEIELDFYLTIKDIEEINEIRHLLQDFFMNKDRNFFQNTYSTLWISIQTLFRKERVLYIPQEKWEDRFKRENENKLPKMTVENAPKRLRKQQKKETVVTSNHYYLIPLQAKELPNARFANYSTIQDAAHDSQRYYNQYTDWKKAKVAQIKKNLRLIDQKTTFLACGTCGTKLCDYNCIGDEIINGFYRHLKCSEFIFKVIACSAEDPFYAQWQLDKIKNHKFLKHGDYVQHTVIGCYQNHELALKVWHRDFAGLQPEQRLMMYKRTQGIKSEEEGDHVEPLNSFPVVENLFITRYSNLIWIYPDDTQEPFDFDKYNKTDLTLKTMEKDAERNRMLQYLSCPICQIDKFAGAQEYKSHMKNKAHQEEYKKFIESLPEVPE